MSIGGSNGRSTGAATAQSVTMYSTVWCGYCRRLKGQMDREGIAYVEVDIENDPHATELVMSVNGGMQTVPTVVFPDGSALTNPSLAQVKAQLAAQPGRPTSPARHDRRKRPGPRRLPLDRAQLTTVGGK